MRRLELVRRDFAVDAALAEAWDRLAQVETWPQWARHIKSVTLRPSGPLVSTSEGVFRLAGGVRSTFRMEAWDPPHRWQWVGRFLTVNVHYDHRFYAMGAARARCVWTVQVDGFGSHSLGRIFGAIYARNLDRGIPRLQAQLRLETR